MIGEGAASGGVGGRGIGGGGDGDGSFVLSKPVKEKSGKQPVNKFIKKLFDMVEDPQTEPIISWGSGGTSFVIWDLHNFSKELLPKYFNTNNFQCFVDQVYNYGFKVVQGGSAKGIMAIGKIREYENKWFQAEKKHLLKNIKTKWMLSKIRLQQERRQRRMASLSNNCETAKRQEWAAPPSTEAIKEHNQLQPELTRNTSKLQPLFPNNELSLDCENLTLLDDLIFEELDQQLKQEMKVTKEAVVNRMGIHENKLQGLGS